ncbi:MAG: caspase family protein [Acidobacteriota bacterium]
MSFPPGLLPGVLAQAKADPVQKQKPENKDTAPPNRQPAPAPGQRSIEVFGEKKAESGAENAARDPLWETGGQAFALIIGVSKYQNLAEKYQLHYADADARSLYEFLTSRNGGFRPENVTLLTNEQATRGQIEESLGKLHNVPKESLVLIFFAGHGEVIKARQEGAEQGLLLPYDFQIETPYASAVQMDTFNTFIKKIRARSIVVLTDACKSGTISDLVSRAQKGRNIAIKEFTESDPDDSQSSFILTAAAPTQNSLELENLRHGVFTYHLLEGLRGQADRDKNGLVTAGEIFRHVHARVLETTERQQEPENNTGYDAAIPLAIVNEDGLPEIRKWFESDPKVARLVSNFDETLRQNQLTTPQGLNAYSYYRRLRDYSLTPPGLAAKKRDELLEKLRTAARARIEESPRDPAVWEKIYGWLEKANELIPDGDKTLALLFSYSRGMRRYYTDEPQRAARELEDTLKKLEDDRLSEPLIAHQIALVFKQTGKLEEANRAYQLAVAERPPVAWRSEFAEVLRAGNKLAEAEKQLRLAQTEQADYQPALKGLAEILLNETTAGGPEKLPARLAEALVFATKVHALAPDDVEVEELYGRALLKNDKVAAALVALRNVARRRLTDDQRRDQSLLQLSQAYIQNHDTGRAIGALREAEQRGSKSALIYDLLGRLFKQQGELARAIAAAQKSVEYAPDSKAEKMEYHRRLAEYYERAGRLKDAAIEYRNAADQAAGDNRLKAALETHALGLAYRSGEKLAEARVAKANTGLSATGSGMITVPGGIAALERLTGIKIDERNETEALALVFDAALRDQSLRARLTAFFDFYPDFLRQAERKGIATGQIVLPGPEQSAAPDAVRDLLRFFGVQDKKGHREIASKKDFNERQHVLMALGGDPAKFERGEAMTLKWKSGQLPVFLGLEQWLNTKEGIKVRENKNGQNSDVWLYLLKNEDRLKLYVGAAHLPEAVAKSFLAGIVPKEGDGLIANSLYFAAPYLRFTPAGQLAIPGGERNWQGSMARFATSSELQQALFKPENGGLLYLFAALSATGPIGDQIANSVSFKPLSQSLQKATLPAAREPFDFIDLLAQLRPEGKDTLRLSKAAETWLGLADKSGVWLALSAKLGNFAPGKSLLLARQLAAIALVERERPDWAGNPKLLGLVAQQAGARRETAIETALDLRMTAEQFERYSERGAMLEAPSAPAEKNKKNAALAAEQLAAKQSLVQLDRAGFELLRLLARSGFLSQTQTAALTERLLNVQPASGNYAFELFAVVKEGMLGLGQAADGQAVERKLLAALANAQPIIIPASKLRTAAEETMPALFAQYDPAPYRQKAIERALASQHRTRLANLAQAIASLEALEANGSEVGALQNLKTALDKFVVSDPPADPKQKKAKEPVNAAPSLKDLAANLSSPVQRAALSEVRRQIAPFVGSVLLDAAAAAHGQLGADEGARAQPIEAAGELRGEALPGDGLSPMLLNAQRLVDARAVTPASAQYVARMLDLGEELVALAALRQAAAERTFGAGLMELLSPRRAAGIRQLLDQGEVKQAIERLAPSELYFLGSRYFLVRWQETPLDGLAVEPGAVGDLAQLLLAERASPTGSQLPESLNGALRQFGMPMTSRAGLLRLELQSQEPYEQALTFQDPRRLTERLQDLKLSLARLCLRHSASADLSLNAALLNTILQAGEREARSATGGTQPAACDWQGWQAVYNEQRMERTLLEFLAGLKESPDRRWLPDPLWDQDAPPIDKAR